MSLRFEDLKGLGGVVFLRSVGVWVAFASHDSVKEEEEREKKIVKSYKV